MAISLHKFHYHCIFQVIDRKPPEDALKKVYFETDYSDYDRVKVLIDQGGIYLDLDVMVAQSFDKLRTYSCTVGLGRKKQISNGVIVCSKDHPFLYMWLQGFYEDHRKERSYNSETYPTIIAKRYPHLVHIEKSTLHGPGYQNLWEIWGNASYPWQTKYSLHTWIRSARQKGFLKEEVTPSFAFRELSLVHAKVLTTCT